MEKEFRQVLRKHLWQDVLRENPRPQAVTLDGSDAVVSTVFLQLETTHTVTTNSPADNLDVGPTLQEARPERRRASTPLRLSPLQTVHVAER